MSANNLVVLLTLSTLKSSEAIPKKSKRVSKVCLKCHMCLVEKCEYGKEMIQS